MSGHISIEVDAASGIVLVTGAGLWSTAQAEAHFRELHQVILQLRAAQSIVFVLADLREATVQTAETAETIRRETGRIYREADRVAIVCATTLLAMQIKRAAQVTHLSAFSSMAAARGWLEAQLAA